MSGKNGDWHREMEGMYRLLLESTDDSIYALDGNMRYILANSATERFAGIPRDELVGKKITEVFPHIEETKFFETFNRVMETKKAETVSDEYAFEDGRKGWYEVRVYPSPNGILCVSRDVTGQREMKRRLEESEEAARMMLNATHDMVALADFDGTIVDLNDSLAKLLGRDKSELAGRNFKDILKKEVFETAYSCAMEVKKTRKPFHFEYGQNGRWFDNLFYPIFDEKGEVCRVADFIQDITERKKAEQALRESMETARTLLNATHDMALLAKKGGIILDLNDSMAELLGGRRGELIGTSLSDHLPPSLFEEKYAPAVEVEKTKKPKRIFTTRNGRWFDSIYYPLFDKNGKVAQIAVFTRDITEQKKAEEKLAESEKKLRTLFDATHDLVLLADVDGTILDMNDAMAESMNGRKEEIIGTNIKEHLPPDIYESRTARVRKIQKTKKPEAFTDGRGGRWFDNNFYPVFDEKGNVDRIAVFTRDVTKEKEAEEHLKKSEERFRTVVENAGEGIGIVDDKEIFVFANPAADEIFGVGMGKLAGRSLMDFLSDEEKEKVSRQTEKRVKGEKSTYELEIIREDGEKRTIIVTVTPSIDSDGKYEGAFGVFRDITEQMEMENELREREERYRKLVETLPDAVTMTDLGGNITYASKRMLELHGFESEEEVLGMNSLKVISPEDHERAINNMKKTLETGFVRNVEYTLVRKDGSTFTGLLSASLIRDADGNPEAFIAVSRDITERKKAEDEVQHLSQFRESIIDNANVWLDVLDEKGNVVIWNRAAENISGYSAEEVVGHDKIWGWLYPDEKYCRQITEKAAAIIEKGEVVEDFETTIRCKDGRIKIISWNSRNLLDGNGKSIGSIALGRDITERKKAEEELEKFKAIADNASYGVAIANIDGTIQYVNDYYAGVHGYKADDIIGKNISIFYDKEQMKRAMELRSMLVDGSNSGAEEVWHTHRDGHVFPMLMSGAVIEDRKGKPAYVAINALDITGYKRMEQELSQRDKMAALGRIASVVSHELNTPLANIGVTAEYLASKLSGEYEEELKIIMSEVDNAADIVKRILGFSRMDNFESKEMDIGEVAGRAADAVRTKHRTDDVIKTRLSSCRVMGDEYRLFEALVNIIENAVLSRDPSKKTHTVKVSSSKSGNSVVITVEDNGVGMDERMVENSSKPFFTTRAKGEGVGLGLFIARWIIEKHGGSLSIESKKNVGTKVSIVIPCGGVA